MIYFNFTCQNPWHKEKRRPWRDLFQGEWPVTKNKVFGFALDYYTYDWFEFAVDTRWQGTDHAGPSIRLTVLGLGVRVSVCDNRHWNYEAGRWVDYTNPQEVKDNG